MRQALFYSERPAINDYKLHENRMMEGKGV